MNSDSPPTVAPPASPPDPTLERKVTVVGTPEAQWKVYSSYSFLSVCYFMVLWKVADIQYVFLSSGTVHGLREDEGRRILLWA